MEKKKIITKGIGASSGKFYGKALKLFTNDHLVLDTHLPPEEIEAEIKKFFTCLKKTRKELEQIIDKQARGLDEDLVDILNSQVYMLEDPLLIEGVENRIRKNRENAVLALYHTIEEISKSFSDLKDEYLRERAVDIRDIGKRLGEALSGEKYDYTALSKLDSEVILVANELTPSQIVHMDKTMVKAIATDLGGRTGHMAILAKNFGIPAVVGLKDITAKVKENEYILVDAENGTVVQNAGIGEIKLYATSSPFQTKEEFKREDKAPSQTKDGHHVSIKVNLETPSDCPTAIRNGAEGIGLYRSETLFLEHEDQCPTEEGQFRAYQKIAKGMKNRPVIIRTFDLGADKFELDFHEDNPFLGNRGIRYCLQNKPMFKTQLNAILRASAFGNLSIMLPMISNAKEIRETRELIEECKTDLTKKNIPFKKDIQLGIMIETPSAAMSIDLLMKDA
ncbi:MAG: phosphoenolpyruvate--protein phosphotransferase, partial [Leptospira sp.]|nr:phosphoenolpyruvate--protein phosphotransferase [Leptospira sp.]